MKKLLIFALTMSMVSLTACQTTQPGTLRPAGRNADISAAPQKLNYMYFNSIDCDGHFNIIVNTKPGKKGRHLTLDSSRGIRTEIKGQTLYLHPDVVIKDRSVRRKDASVKKNSRTNADDHWTTVWINNISLKNIRLRGHCRLSGNRLKTYPLNLKMSGNSYTHLRGVIPVHKIQTADYAMADIQWANGPDITIWTFGRSQVNIAGRTNELHTRAFGHSSVNAKYLRAEQVYAQSGNRALIKVIPTYALSAFASGASNIYYFKTPGPNLKLTRVSGNVLQMGFFN